MEFGIHLLGLGRRASVADYVTATKAAEELGYHSVWINDHVIIPTQHASRYPYSADGRPSFTPDDSFYDPFVLLAAKATELKRLCVEQGKDFASLTICVFPANRAYFTLDAIRTYRQHGASILLAPVGSPKIEEFVVQLRQFRDEVMEPARAV